MRQPRIFLEPLLAPHSRVTVAEDTAHYLLHVLRVVAGQELTVFDGQGGEYPARVAETAKKSLVLALGERRALELESPLKLVLAQGIARNEHMDYILQKAVELGVSEIVPLICARTQHHDAARLDKRQRHWAGIVRSACEQCGRNRLPPLHRAQPLTDWLAGPEPGLRLMLAPEGGHSLRELPLPKNRVVLLVGPEGGFSAAETAAMSQYGCVPVRLGPRVLRTETAGLAALAICQSLWGDLA